MKTPKIIKKADKKVTEFGCCFRSCGGSPAIMDFDCKDKHLSKKLKKIK